MITVHAIGFVADKPVLTVIRQNLCKCEFTVLSSRKERRSSETIWERANFVAWNEDAERIASMLERGSNVACYGRQETSSWVGDDGTKRYATKYRLTDWEFLAIKSAGSASNPSEARQPSRAPEAPRNQMPPGGGTPPPGASHRWRSAEPDEGSSFREHDQHDGFAEAERTGMVGKTVQGADHRDGDQGLIVM
ncbi:MAG: hypothetical protein CVU22_07365 [Betaproteobacteria bacterium HGW-Betaproteobacteria-16]|nr:MAG: hypothetical protein CVU22_07365 [Betaproteobacteria bacterium HGW-Betaproteobacteria-16]